MERSPENAVEWLTNASTATVTASQPRLITALKKYAKDRPNECQIVATNPDGTIVAHVPTTWAVVRPPRKMELSEERKEELRESAKRLRSKSKKS